MISKEFARIIPLDNAWPIGFAFQTLWIPLIVRQSHVDHGSVDIHLVFYSAFGMFSLIIALFFAFRRFDDSRVSYTGMCIFSLLCELFASAALTFDLFAGFELIAFIGSVVGAIGLVMSMLAWGSFFQRLPLKESMAYILIAYMICFFLQPWCYLLFPTGTVLVMSVLSVGGPFCLIMAYATLLPETPTPQSASTPMSAPATMSASALASMSTSASISAAMTTSSAPSAAKPTSSSVYEGSLAGINKNDTAETPRNHVPFLRLLVALAVYSFVLTLRNPMGSPSSGLAIVVLYSIALLFTIAMYWAIVVLRTPPAFELLMQLLLAVFTVGFFMQPFTPEILSDVPSTLLMVATALIYMLVWMAVVATMRLSKIHPFAIVGIWGACYGCPRLLYYVLEAFIPLRSESAETTMAVALVALFGLFIVFFLVSRQPSGSFSFFKELRWPDDHLDDAASPLPAWQAIAHKHGLTDRECEVFYLICAGHSRRYVAEHLFISENTVKAHLKRIYAKLGIHSKYDLERFLGSEP